MITEDQRKKLIVRQSCMNRACELLIAEQMMASSCAMIPIASIKKLTLELEKIIWEEGSANELISVEEKIKKKIILG